MGYYTKATVRGLIIVGGDYRLNDDGDNRYIVDNLLWSDKGLS